MDKRPDALAATALAHDCERLSLAHVVGDAVDGLHHTAWSEEVGLQILNREQVLRALAKFRHAAGTTDSSSASTSLGSGPFSSAAQASSMCATSENPMTDVATMGLLIT